MTERDDIKIAVEKLEKGSLNERREAVITLSEKGSKAVEPLTELLCADIDNDTRWYASNALAKIGEPAVDSLIYILEHFPDDNVKRYAAAALAGIGEPAIAGLIAVFEGDDSISRGFASKALIRMGEPAVEPLNEYIKGSDPESVAHRCAVLTFHKLGSEDPSAVEKALQ